MIDTPEQEWWTAQELAEAGLPDIPGTKRRVNAMADREGWSNAADCVRRRKGRGGGIEYHWTLLPMRARTALLAASTKEAHVPERADREAAWANYEQRTAKQKETAAQRLGAVQEAEALVSTGLTMRQACREVARIRAISDRSIWSWLSMIEGVPAEDRLAYLVPQTYRSGRRRTVEIDSDFMALIRSDYLRPERPALRAAYRRAGRIFERAGKPVPAIHTVEAELKRTVSIATMTLARKGLEALKRMYPSQIRDKSAMHAMEAVNGDFHRFDVFARWPGEQTPIRPQMVAFQDIYSGRILAWRVDKTANSHAVQLCLGDMIEDWGIPQHVLLDNGREFAAKTITGGSKTRYRFKVKEDDIPGLLTSLGCEIHWATPYSGQSKPIERAFRDLCEDVSKDPRLAGAYTGNAPDAKPENYGNRAIPLDEFLKVLAEGIELHNTRRERRSEVAYGRSFAEVFDESYAQFPIRKATAEQRRMWLMGAEGVRPDKRTGLIKFMGNTYFDEFLHSHMGEKLIARFDQAALWDGLHVYSMDERYLGHVPIREKIGFFDVEEGRTLQRVKKAWAKAERERKKALELQTAADLGAMLDEAAAEPTVAEPKPDAKVVQIVPPRRKARKASPMPSPTSADIARIEDRLAQKAAQNEQETPKAKFARALQLERDEAAGTKLTKEQARWLASYQTSADYRTWKKFVEDHGEQILGTDGG